MKILLLGSGGREHALAWKIAQSEKVEKLFVAPGNAGTRLVGENVAIKADDFDAIAAFVKAQQVEMLLLEMLLPRIPSWIAVPAWLPTSSASAH